MLGKPWVLAIIAILYVLLRYDLIPDSLRPFGLLDDLALVAYLLFFRRKRAQQHDQSEVKDQSTFGDSSEQDGDERKNLDAWEVLEAKRGMSELELKKLYREKVARYHPDKVSHLGEEFQKIAHQKTLELQKAFDQIIKEIRIKHE